MTWAPLLGQANVWYGGTKVCSCAGSNVGALLEAPACVALSDSVLLSASASFWAPGRGTELAAIASLIASASLFPVASIVARSA